MTQHYFLFAVMLFLYSGTGYALGARTAMTAALIGVGNAGIITNILAVYSPNLISHTLIALAACGGIGLYKARSTIADSLKRSFATPANFYANGLTIAFVGITTRHFSPEYWIYEAHDVLYFTPSLEMLQASYSSPLRIFTYYPEEMAGFHHFSSGIVAALSLPIPRPTLIDMVAARHFLIITSLYLFLRPQVSTRPIATLITSYAILVVFGTEISYSLSISSYFYVLLLFGVAFVFTQRDETPQTFVLLLLVMSCAKGPIFYSAFLAAALAITLFHQQISRPIAIIYSILVVGCVYAWTIPPPPYHGMSLRTNFYNPISPSYCQQAVTDLYNWTLTSPIISQIKKLFGKSDSPITTIAVLLRTSLLFYAVPLIILQQLGKKFFDTNREGCSRPAIDQIKMSMILVAYTVISLAGFIWVRNGIMAKFQAHSPILAASLSAAVLIVWVAEKRYSFQVLATSLALIAVLMPRGQDLLTLPDAHTRIAQASAMRHGGFTWQQGDALPKANIDGWYRPPLGEAMIKSELLAGLTGQRLRKADAKHLPDGQIQYWRTGDHNGGQD